MTPTDIGDGGPPIDIPDAWLPNWQDHVRAALARGEALRRRDSAIRMFRWAGGASDRWIAARSGLPVEEVAALRASRGPRPVTDGDLVALGRRILDYRLDDDDWVRPRTPVDNFVRNPPRPVRLIAAEPLEHTEIAITITTLAEPP